VGGLLGFLYGLIAVANSENTVIVKGKKGKNIVEYKGDLYRLVNMEDEGRNQ
jgi:hypothetical protein